MILYGIILSFNIGRDCTVKCIDIVGNRYGRLVVTSRADSGPDGKARFVCQCDCGEETTVASINLRKGLTTSCGCYRKEFRKTGHDPAINSLYSTYKRSASKKGREFSLTKEEFTGIVLSDCAYCGEPPMRAERPSRIVTGLLFNGIDRKDNSKGYVASNVQACCTICNQAKHTLSESAFTSWIDKLIEHRIKNHGT